jgi:hypothetical protein
VRIFATGEVFFLDIGLLMGAIIVIFSITHLMFDNIENFGGCNRQRFCYPSGISKKDVRKIIIVFKISNNN